MKSDGAKISIVVPVKNGRKTLGECLQALALQTYKNYEIILVDNNSSDSTKSIILRFQQKYPNIKYFFEKKPGIGQARNTGEKQAQGEIILMTDADCFAPRYWAEKMAKPILNKKAIAAQGAFKKPQNANYWQEHFYAERNRIMEQNTKNQKIDVLYSGNFAIKKSVLEEIEYSSQKMKTCNDVELMSRLKKNNYDVFFEPIEVLHAEPDNFLKVFKKTFIGGFWSHGLIEKNDNAEFFKNIWREYRTKHIDFKYNLTTGLAWRLGRILAKLAFFS